MAKQYCPEATLPTDGRLLPIVQYQALFSLLGNNFGGDGKSSFGLPTLQAPGKGLLYCIAVNGMYPNRPLAKRPARP